MIKRIAIIPARSGSKGIPRKNLRLFVGRPLITWTIETALNSGLYDSVVVSTDDEEISEVAMSAGAEVPFLRPSRLAQDDTPTIDVVLDLIEKLPGYAFGTLLQPTSPLTSLQDLIQSVKLMEDLNAQSLVSVTKTKSHPSWVYTIESTQRLRPISTEMRTSRRQDLQPVFSLNGAIYSFSTSWLQQEKRFITQDTIGFEMPRERSVDIDDEYDWTIATLLQNLIS